MKECEFAAYEPSDSSGNHYSNHYRETSYANSGMLSVIEHLPFVATRLTLTFRSRIRLIEKGRLIELSSFHSLQTRRVDESV